MSETAKYFVFKAIGYYPFYEMIEATCPWFFSKELKKKSVLLNYYSAYPEEVDKVLCLSSSEEGLGRAFMPDTLLTEDNISIADAFIGLDRVKYGKVVSAQNEDYEKKMWRVGGSDRLLDGELVNYKGLCLPSPDFQVSLPFDCLYYDTLWGENNRVIREELLSSSFSSFFDFTSFGECRVARSLAIFKGMKMLSDRKYGAFDAMPLSLLLESWRVDLGDPDYMLCNESAYKGVPRYSVNNGYSNVKQVPMTVKCHQIEG